MSQPTQEQAAFQIRATVAVAPSHVHLTPGVIEQLFCDHYRLHERSRLGRSAFAAEESVALIGPKGRLTGVRVIGPPRKANQVELSKADALKLGIDAPKRAPGDLEATPGILIKGPRTQVALTLGVIRVQAHLHIGSDDADRLGLAERDRLDVVAESDPGRILFRDVPVRVSPCYLLELHLEADDGKAAGLAPGDRVLVRKSSAPGAQSGEGHR